MAFYGEFCLSFLLMLRLGFFFFFFFLLSGVSSQKLSLVRAGVRLLLKHVHCGTAHFWPI